MCGIFGVVNYQLNEVKTPYDMSCVQAVLHRGPDEGGSPGQNADSLARQRQALHRRADRVSHPERGARLLQRQPRQLLRQLRRRRNPAKMTRSSRVGTLTK